LSNDDKIFSKILEYAKAHCEDRCPAERDPETCMELAELCREYGIEGPPCTEEGRGLTRESFESKIREIEERHGKPIEDVMKEYGAGGVKSLDDQIDKMEAEFALAALRVLKEREAGKGKKQWPHRLPPSEKV